MKPERVVGVVAVVLLACAAGVVGSLFPWTAELRKPWSSSDWAAWVQAIGSVAAIVAAIVISRDQAGQRKREAQGTAALFCMQLVESAMRVQKLVATSNFAPLEIEMATLDELILLGRSVPAGALSPRNSWYFTRVLARGVGLRTMVSKALAAATNEGAPPANMATAFSKVPASIVKTIGRLPDSIGEGSYANAYWRLLKHHKLEEPHWKAAVP